MKLRSRTIKKCLRRNGSVIGSYSKPIKNRSRKKFNRIRRKCSSTNKFISAFRFTAQYKSHSKKLFYTYTTHTSKRGNIFIEDGH